MTNNDRAILLADDDADDREMVRKALQQHHLAGSFFTVEDGEDLLDYLYRRGRYSPAELSPTPGLILLDLNMPRKSGLEALAEIKADARLRRIPIVILTTSTSSDDIGRTYQLGSNSFITKPKSQTELSDVMSVLGQYWFDVAKLPPNQRN